MRHLEHGQIVVIVIRGDRARTCALGHDALRVLIRPPALQLGAADLQERSRSKSSISASETREIFSLVLPPFPKMKAASSTVIFMMSTP